MELREKEKKAIEILKEIKDVRGIRQDVEGENEDLWALDIVYNLIEKQQKEIEEKNKDIKKLNDLLMLSELDYISKDKIREKIEHYNDELEHIKNGEEFENEKPMYYWGKAALEELL